MDVASDGAVVDAPWLPLAEELADDLGITRRLTFLESARASMPMAAGVFSSAVLMPEDANRWPLERLRIVLLHELAHVKRRDCLTHVIAQTACALHWFNPLAWIAARHIRTERERACDDLVLACGTEGPDYAEELLEIARVMRGGRFPAVLAGATLAMAHRSQLEGRLIAILDPKVPRSGVSRTRAVIATALVACALPPLATMQPWAVATVEGPRWLHPMRPQHRRRRFRRHRHRLRRSRTRNPNPQPATHVNAPQAAQAIADAVSVSASETISQHAQAIAESAVQGAIQAGVQSTAIGGAERRPRCGSRRGQCRADIAGRQARGRPAHDRGADGGAQGPDKDVRETAMHALVQLRDPAIFEPLVQALGSVSRRARAGGASDSASCAIGARSIP